MPRFPTTTRPIRRGREIKTALFLSRTLEREDGKYLLRFESGRDPGVLLQRAARVVVRGGVPLEFVHELGYRLLHLDGHGCHCMLLPATLAVHADLPAEDTRQSAPLGPYAAPKDLHTLASEIYEHWVKTNAPLINHSRGEIAPEGIEFLQKQDVTLWSLFAAAINHTIKTGPRALLFLKGNLSQNVNPPSSSLDNGTHADRDVHIAESSKCVFTINKTVGELQPRTVTGSNSVQTHTRFRAKHSKMDESNLWKSSGGGGGDMCLQHS